MSVQDNISASDATGGDPTLLNRLAWSVRWSDRDKSSELAHRACNIAEQGQDAKSVMECAMARRTLAWQAKWRGDFDGAMEHALIAESGLTERDHPAARGDIYSILGVVHYSRNRLDLALGSVERGLMLVKDSDATETYVDLLTALATVQRISGDRARASATLGQACAIAQGADLARVDHNVARWLHNDGEAKLGLERTDKALALADNSKNRVILPYLHQVAGSCLSDLGRHAEAAERFDKGLKIALEDRDIRAQCQNLRHHGNLELKCGNIDHASELFTQGAGIAADLSYPLWQKAFALALADVCEMRGDVAGALQHHKDAWRYQAAGSH